MPAHRPGAARPASSHPGAGKSFVTDEVLISERPAEAEDRAVPGHWEGDLILGLAARRSARWSSAPAGSRCCCTCRRWSHDGPRVKNGPALTGHGAEAVRDAIATTITTLPEQLRRSLTWDQGAEMAQHAQLRIETGLQVYFCDPRSPGSAAPTRTPTGCCASTSRRAPTSPPQRRRPRRRRRRAQRPAAQDARLENAGRGIQRVPDTNRVSWPASRDSAKRPSATRERLELNRPAATDHREQAAGDPRLTRRTRLSPLRPALRGEPPRRQPRHPSNRVTATAPS